MQSHYLKKTDTSKRFIFLLEGDYILKKVQLLSNGNMPNSTEIGAEALELHIQYNLCVALQEMYMKIGYPIHM